VSPAKARKQTDSTVTLIVLAMVTCLIWLFAESQTLTRVDVDVLVRLESTPTRVASWRDGRGDENVTLTLEGPRSEIESAASRLRREGVTLGIGAPGGPDATAGEHRLNLDEAVGASAADLLGSASVIHSEPPARTAVVDEVATLEDVAVVFDATGLDLAEAPGIEPATIDISGPSSVLATLGDEPVVTARSDASVLGALRPGATQRVEARLDVRGLRPADRSRITLLPGRVSVRLAVRSRVSTIDVASAPVQVLGLASDFAQWRVTAARQFVDGLTVTGPSDLVSRIEAQELSVVAVIRLTSDELLRGISEKAPTYALLSQNGIIPAPASLEVDGPNEAIGLTIEDASPASP
jgi:hypothetical protein